jgi:hypothetical protein
MVPNGVHFNVNHPMVRNKEFAWIVYIHCHPFCFFFNCWNSCAFQDLFKELMNPLIMILDQLDTRLSTHFVMGNHVIVGLFLMNLMY